MCILSVKTTTDVNVSVNATEITECRPQREAQ